MLDKISSGDLMGMGSGIDEVGGEKDSTDLMYLIKALRSTKATGQRTGSAAAAAALGVGLVDAPRLDKAANLLVKQRHMLFHMRTETRAARGEMRAVFQARGSLPGLSHSGKSKLLRPGGK